MHLLPSSLLVTAVVPMALGKVKLSARRRESTRVSNGEVPTSIRGQMETMRRIHKKMV
jgi:hypothetical protein